MGLSSSTTAKTSKQLESLKNHVYTMVAAFAGVVFGVLGSMGFVSGYIHSQFASENASLSHAIVSMAPTAVTTSACTVPSTTSAKSANAVKPLSATAPVLTAMAPASPGHPAGGMGGGTFVNQIVDANISDTGPNSHNSINTTNSYKRTVTNNNNINVSSTNDQQASSGSASESTNTNGGSADSGDASNSNATSYTFNVSN